MSDVVVVLPLLPVMHTILASVYRPANSISLTIPIPLAMACCTMGAWLGIPGLFTISLALSIFTSVCRPSSQSMPWLSSICLYLSLMGPMSETNTSKPFCLAKMAAPTPLSAAPNITILSISTFPLLFVVVVSAHRQLSNGATPYYI